MSLAHAARLLGGEASGDRVLCPGPGHSPSDRSLSVWFKRDAADGFIVNSFAGDSFLLCRDHVRRCLHIARGTDRFVPRRKAQRLAAQPSGPLGIWAEARNPIGTPVEVYLASRALQLARYAPGTALRFHPSCPFNGTRTPAMVAFGVVSAQLNRRQNLPLARLHRNSGRRSRSSRRGRCARGHQALARCRTQAAARPGQHGRR
jgi:putative DNA primase/helicase